jgi:hypothetical protein
MPPETQGETRRQHDVETWAAQLVVEVLHFPSHLVDISDSIIA